MVGIWLGVRAKKRKVHVVLGLWLELGQKYRKAPFVVGLWLGLGPKKRKYTLGLAFGYKIEKDSLCCSLLLRVWAKI